MRTARRAPTGTTLSGLALVATLAAGCGRLGFAVVDLDGGPDARGVPDAGPDAPRDAGPPPDFCMRIPALPAPPVLDGTPESGLALEHLDPQGWTSGDPIPAGLDARFAVAWRPDGLYFVIDVTDPDRVVPQATEEIYCGDGAEVYVDHDGVITTGAYDAVGTRQLIAVAPIDDATPATRGAIYQYPVPGFLPWTRGFAVVPRAGGYVMEVFVDAAALSLPAWTLRSGASVGVDLSVNVSRPMAAPGMTCRDRLGQYFLSVTTPGADACGGAPFCNATAFCTPSLE